MPTEKCRYCDKEIYDYTKFRLNQKLKQHTRDKHEKRGEGTISIDGIPKDIYDILLEVNKPIRFRNRISIV